MTPLSRNMSGPATALIGLGDTVGAKLPAPGLEGDGTELTVSALEPDSVVIVGGE